MSTSKVENFIAELKQLQAKYGLYIIADYKEDWDYDCGDNYICLSVNPELVLRDSNDNYYSLYTNEIYM